MVAPNNATRSPVNPTSAAIPDAHVPNGHAIALSRHRHAEPPLSRERLEAAYRVHSPLTYALAVPKERVLIIAARGDRIVPPDHPYALWKHWGEPAIHWYSGSHFAPFRRPDILAAGQRHLEHLGIL